MNRERTLKPRRPASGSSTKMRWRQAQAEKGERKRELHDLAAFDVVYAASREARAAARLT
jgi:hypothetical protein